MKIYVAFDAQNKELSRSNNEGSLAEDLVHMGVSSPIKVRVYEVVTNQDAVIENVVTDGIESSGEDFENAQSYFDSLDK